MATATRTPALKEWAVIVRALLSGEQIVDVRKGGLREDGRHFAVPTSRCWLYPTVEHQRSELLKPAYRHWLDATAGPADGGVRIDGWANIVTSGTITEPEHLKALDSKLVWMPEYPASRLRWKARDPLWVLVLRAYRLEEPLEIPWRDEYAGCTSWVDLDGLPADPADLPSEPALSDVAFGTRFAGVRDALPPGTLEPVAAG